MKLTNIPERLLPPLPARRLPQLPRDAESGARVIVVEDDFTVTLTTTRSAPWELGCGEWVVLLVGRAGGYSLERCFTLDL